MAKIIGEIKQGDTCNFAEVTINCPHCGGVARKYVVKTNCSTLEEYLKTVEGSITHCFNTKCRNKPIIIQGKWANRYEKRLTANTRSHQTASGF